MKLEINSTKLDKTILDFVTKYRNQIFAIIITILALWIRNSFRGYTSGDLVLHLIPWCEYAESHGGFLALAKNPPANDYPITYQYILAFLTYLPASYLAKIKVISVIFDFVSAFFVGLFVKKIGSYTKQSIVPYLAYAVTLFVPTIIMNSAAWGQRDILYTTFVIIALYCFSEEKYSPAFIMYGMAFSLKLQAVFVLPLFLFLYLKTKKFSILNFLWIPVVYFVVYIPALFLGKPLSDIFTAYSTQVGEYKSTVLNFGNIYNLLPNNYELFSKAGIIMTIVVLALVFFYLLSKDKLEIDAKLLVDLAFVSVMICAYLLPAMHERYMFAADVLGVIYLFAHKDKPYIPILVWFINASGYVTYLFAFGPWVDNKYLALIYLGVVVLVIKGIIDSTKKKPQVQVIPA
ncbi:MAG: glycosyltransferase 87 family protein [Anaerolineaceae bacterium]